MLATTDIRTAPGLDSSKSTPKTRFEFVERSTAWRLDRRRSSFALHIDGRASGLTGQFRTVSGSVNYDEEQPADSRIGVELEIMPGADLMAGSPHRERLGQEARRDDPGIAMTFWTKKVEVEGPTQLQVTGEITIPGATRDVEFQVVQSGEGRDRDGTHRIHFWAWTRIRPQELGDLWEDALEMLGVHRAGVVDIVMGVELMGMP